MNTWRTVIGLPASMMSSSASRRAATSALVARTRLMGLAR
jgi:hypothetical protein